MFLPGSCASSGFSHASESTFIALMGVIVLQGNNELHSVQYQLCITIELENNNAIKIRSKQYSFVHA